MSWNRLLGYMIKSGSLLSANQPSCHPVKQTLNRFFGSMQRAACQPDMNLSKKKKNRHPAPRRSPMSLSHPFPASPVFAFFKFPFLYVFNSIGFTLTWNRSTFPLLIILLSHPVLLSCDKVVVLPGWDHSPGLNGVAVWGQRGPQTARFAAELCIYYLFQNRAHT